MTKKYTIYGIQSIHHKTEVEANSKEEALTLVNKNHENYDWDQTDAMDWDYECE